MKKITTILALLLVNIAFAQDFYDALRYSQTEYGGTARSIAMGSAFGALGGDFISASINPAGLGLYRSDEFTISPTLNMNQVDASYLRNNEGDTKYNFNFNNISYVATAETGITKGFVSFNFGVGYNRLKNFHSNRLIQGYDANTTLLDTYSTNADNVSPSDVDFYDEEMFEEGMAFDNFLLNAQPDPTQNEDLIYWYNPLTNYSDELYEYLDDDNKVFGYAYDPVSIKPHQQKAIINESGKIDEYNISLGLNFNHKIYLGASLGINDLQYSQSNSYSEIDNNDLSSYFSRYTLNKYIEDTGMGINFKAGVIIRPVKSFRLGASIQTPTFYTITRNESIENNAFFDKEVGYEDQDGSYYDTHWDSNIEFQTYDYNFETPLKAIISAAYIIDLYAIISADYEIVSYNTMKFRDTQKDPFDYSVNNSDISSMYSTTGNLRIGAEIRATPNFSLRAGYNLLGNPWNKKIILDETQINWPYFENKYSSYSAGLGYRNNKFFIDFAYRLNHSEYSYKVHQTINPENAFATLTELNHQATLTLGFRF